MWRRAVSFVNAQVVTPAAPASTIRFDSKILGLDERPRPRDEVVDLDGAFVLPGLVNAHDHLELNHYGRLKFRGRYQNVSAWIEDMRPRLRDDPSLRIAQSYALGDRLFIGGLKNLLSGVTTVAHHNPLYRELNRWFPIRVVRRYGWAHSFYLERAPTGANGELGGEIAERHRATPPDVPFIVHLAEGVDAEAHAELDCLDLLGCLTPNLVLVHGVALEAADWSRVVRAAAGLVWCPGSNFFLFDRTAPVGQFLNGASGNGHARLALGTDSRLTGRRDLLEELDVAAQTDAAPPERFVRMVTSEAADLLRLPDAGRIRLGAPADLVVVPRLAPDFARALLAATRRDLLMVVVDGRPLVSDPRLARAFDARRVTARRLLVDGAPKLADSRLVRRIVACPIREPGVEAA